MGAHHLLGEGAHQVDVSLRVDSVAAYGGPDFGVERVHEPGVDEGRGDRHVQHHTSRE